MVQPFTQGVSTDMFWPYAPYNFSASALSCQQTWGVTPRESWARVGLLGKRIKAATKIIFSNGKYDPWTGGGVHGDLPVSLYTVEISSGAHHIDLMFSDDADPADVTAARLEELKIIQSWIRED